MDDVFNWRKDLPKHPSKFLWSKEDNRNFIDRFAYHHFYLWLSQKDDLVDIESVDKILFNEDLSDTDISALLIFTKFFIRKLLLNSNLSLYYITF